MKEELIPLEKALNFQIFKLSLLLARELTKSLKEFGLSPERWQVLAALWNAGRPLNQTELSAITIKDKPSISRLVESMVEAGWLTRKPSKQDSRAYLINPSSKANNSREKIITALYGHFKPLLQQFGEENQKNLSSLVLQYTAIIEDIEFKD